MMLALGIVIGMVFMGALIGGATWLADWALEPEHREPTEHWPHDPYGVR